MKKLLLLLLFTNIVYAQTSRVQQDLNNFKPGELIVKLKDNVDAKVYYSKSGKATSSFNIGELLGIESKLASSEVLFHEKSIKASIANKQKIKALYMAKGAASPNNGYMQKEPMTMKNVFVLKTSNTQENIPMLVEQIKGNQYVEYVEPNYIFRLNDFEVGELITEADVSKIKPSAIIPINDPLYSSQENITASNIDDMWTDYGTGDGSQIVAVLDTGVDYTHPDLEANIWINEAEQNGVEGFDDDGNGFIDDIRGWDFINSDNTPLDDNMHGTHVAGIIGAVGNNEKGIAGAAWNVKIMPVKVFQSNGTATSINIALGVDYARVAGATIQNYSFGSYAESNTAKIAYENAYSSSLLVAASGNNKKCIGPGVCPDKTPSAPLYPGAYTYVLGVEDGGADYDNFDQDGPIYSGYSNYLNYELKAIGTSVISTVPNGGYRNLTGTSMAAPLVSGAMAIYNQYKPDDSKELIFGNLINTSGSLVDFSAALNVTPTPLLKVMGAEFKDENDNNDNEYFQPGKTLLIYPTIKNYWGPTDDVRVGIEFAEFEDSSKAEIIENEIAIGSVSAYGALKITDKFLKIKLSEDIANKVIIKFKLSVWSGENKDYLSSKEIEIEATNAIVLEDYITTDMTLLEDNLYVFEGNMILTNGITLTIEPGVTIRMGNQRKIYVDGNSTIIANGTKEKPIIIQPDPNVSAWAGVVVNSGTVTFNYTHFKNLYKLLYDKPMFTGGTYNNCLFYDLNVTGADFSQSATFNYSNFIDSYFRWGTLDGTHNYSTMSNMNYLHFLGSNPHNYDYNDGAAKRAYNYNNSHVVNYLCSASVDKQTIEHPLLRSSGNIIGELPLPKNVYFGSSSKEKLKEYFTDYRNDDTLTAKFNYDDLVLTPFEEPHGIVWKVLVNGKDSQDEYEEIDPVGVGEHEFKVYFNRKMDTLVKPQISYGVRIPYVQKGITEAGSWSEDSKIYTVNHDINIGAADGINRIRIQGARDLDNFEIPIERNRFNMLIQSAGSASTGFYATAGLGEISLEWDSPREEDLADVLGYNIYRFEALANETYTDTIMVNNSLISDLSYQDYDVVRNKQYFYSYKILRTNFKETDYSKIVSTELLTANLGDSNGDNSVDVLDVVNTVDYILNNIPSPFIDYATDVNNDSNINVLDVVGIVDLILNPTSGKTATNGPNSITYYSNIAVGEAIFSWEGNDLFITSNYDIGGIQLAFNQDFEYTLSDNLPGVERLNYTQGDAAVLMLYSFNNTVIANAKTKILTRANASQEFDINLAVVGTTNGAKLNAVLNNGTLGTIDAPFQSNQLELLKLYPNPSDGIVTLQYYLPEIMDGITVKIYDIQGRLVWKKDLDNVVGKTEKQLQLNKLKAGNYIVLMSAYKHGGVKYLSHKILIIQ